ncbi:MAG: glycosyltransferase family 4 protein [Erythrobacter sp.]
MFKPVRASTPSKPVIAPIIAIVSKQRLTGSNNGSSAYLIALAKTMRDAGFAVNLIQPSPAIAGRTPILKMMPEMSVFGRHRIRRGLRIGRFVLVLDPIVLMLALLGGARLAARRLGLPDSWTKDQPRPHSVGTPWTEGEKRFARKMIPDTACVVVADYVFAAPVLSCAPDHAAKMIVMHDLFHARDGGGQDSVAQLSRDKELALLGMGDAIVTIQQDEHAFIERELAGKRALLAPMPARPVDRSAPGDPDRLLFVGSNTAPNTAGLAWFLDDVWPAIKRSRPATRLDVVGSVCRSLSGAITPEGVVAHGVVPELADFYASAGIVISPLKFGSGLKIKLVEAMAYGKAAVVTSTTLQGVEALCQSSVALADSADAFARAVLHLQTDNEARAALAESARQCANTHFSSQSVHRELRSWLEAQLDA